MTYNVFGGTLNLAQSQSLAKDVGSNVFQFIHEDRYLIKSCEVARIDRKMDKSQRFSHKKNCSRLSSREVKF